MKVVIWKTSDCISWQMFSEKENTDEILRRVLVDIMDCDVFLPRYGKSRDTPEELQALHEKIADELIRQFKASLQPYRSLRMRSSKIRSFWVDRHVRIHQPLWLRTDVDIPRKTVLQEATAVAEEIWSTLGID